MQKTPRTSLFLLGAALWLGAAGTLTLPAAKAKLQLPETGLDEQTRILHALNRLGYGPRPGDLERVSELGLENYIAAQLHPETIADIEVERRLKSYETLGMSPAELLTAFPPPQLLRGIGQILTARGGMDPAAVRELFPELERMEQRKQAVEAGEDPRQMEASRDPAERMQRVMDSPLRIVVELGQAKLIRAVESERQLQEVMTDFWFNHFNVYAGKGTGRWWVSSFERDVIRPRALGNFRDLLGAVAEHPAMLFYLDNWLSSSPDAEFDRGVAERYAAQANREQGLPAGGVATLILRERGMDTREMERRIERRSRSGSRRGRAPAQENSRFNGLNENYARELLELHTLGVDAGYTQQDIVEIARCFTGWTLLPLHAGQGFVFMDELHERGAKQVLGTKIKSGGVTEGRAVLDLLAEHPATARFISTKLARRFVADEPPADLVERMAETFLDSGGEIREVMLTMIRSEEFWSAENVEAKVKTPLEFTVSLLRATDAELSDLSRRRKIPGALIALRDLGQPPYGAQPPTGYADSAEAWVSTGALLQRFRVGFAVAADKLPGVRVDVADAPRDQPSDEYLIELGRELTGKTLSPSTIEALQAQLDLPPDELEELGLPAHFAHSPEARSRLALAWIAASSEFQRK